MRQIPHRTAIVLSTAAAASTAACVEPERSTRDTREIVGGQETDLFPAVVSIRQYGNTTCSGTIIAPRRVATAAHCLGGGASGLDVAVGPSVYAPEHILPVTAAVQHPQYDGYTMTNDIAYLELGEDAPVAPIGVASTGPAVGESLLFVGYGFDNGVTGSGIGVKRRVSIPVTGVDATTFRYDHSSRQTCSGDSGGPALRIDSSGVPVLAGVTSYGDRYCVDYGVDTRTDTYLEFLGATPSTPPEDACGDETYVGRCEDGQVIWCEQDAVQTQDCSAQGLTCGFSDADGFYACLQDDPCEGETYEGRCDGNEVIWCEDGVVHTDACDAGTSCGYSDQNMYYACVPDQDQSCCKVCSQGKACGDTCIAVDATCSQPAGCACDA